VGELGVYAAQGLAPPWPGGGPLPEFILGPRLSVIGGGAAIPGATLTFEQVCRTPPSYTATKVWWQNDAVLVGPDTSYLIQPSDVGTSIYVSCTATNENGSTTASSNTIFIVAAP
jgi:hypothetical protein